MIIVLTMNTNINQRLDKFKASANEFSQYDIPQELVVNGDETGVTLIGFMRQGHLTHDSYQELLVVQIHRRH